MSQVATANGSRPDAAGDSAAELADRLSAPFDPRELKCLPKVVKDRRAMAIVYVDARVVMDRLDDVFGVDGWQDEYDCLANGAVMCRLKVRIGDGWVTRTDAGGASEQPDGGDRMKAAFSDALKRAAVKFGVGRYLYRLPGQWLDYDPEKRKFTQAPSLPPWAVPAVAGKAGEALPPPPAKAPRALPANQKASMAQVEDVKAAAANLGITPAAFGQRLYELFSTTDVRQLSAAEADDILAKMKAARAAKKPAMATVGDAAE